MGIADSNDAAGGLVSNAKGAMHHRSRTPFS